MRVGVAVDWLRRARLSAAGLLCALLVGAPSALAQDAPPPDEVLQSATPAAEPAAGTESDGEYSSGMLAGGGAIARIRVEGTQRIEPETVASYLVVGPGDVFDPETIDLSLKRLFSTGLFADVTMRREGNDLIVSVIENPIVNRVVFEGNRTKDDDKLLDEIEIRPRQVFTRARVQADITRIVELYRRAGRFAARVTPKIVELPQNRVDLVFEISEGPVTDVAKINFIGNRAFTDRTLRKEIVTRESSIWTTFSSNDNYDPDRVAYDSEQLRKFYLKNGYADFSVVSSVAELTPEGDAFIITYTLDEGEQYQFGEVTVETTLQELDPHFLQLAVGIGEGETYNAERIDAASDSITFIAGTVGYAFVDVNPRPSRREGENVIDIVLEVNEGPRVYVERINIRGNSRTLDKVIRREMRVVEGDAFNRILIDRSRTRIRALGFFKDVTITEEPGTEPDRTILDVAVEEQPTGELSLGIGFSSEDFVGDISVSERNLLGRGQFLRMRIAASQRQQQIDLRFTEPYFLDRQLAAGFDIYKTLADYEEEAGYKSDTFGVGLRTGFPLTEYASLSLNYLFEYSDLEVPASACNSFLISRVVCDQRGQYYSSSIGYQFMQDRRDDPIDPTRGATLMVSQFFAGAGGDTRFLRTEIETSRYLPVFKGIVLSLDWQAGYIWSYSGEGVRVNQRFFKGGSTFRGFETAGVGPRDLVTGDALGGKAYGIGTAELHLPLGLPEEYGIKAALFGQVGTLGILDDADLGASGVGRQCIPNFQCIKDDLSWRSSVGISFFWDSPFGPVRVDLAEAISREDYDKTESFRFSGGTRF